MTLSIDDAAAALGIELLPWQREVGQRILNGESSVDKAKERPVTDADTIAAQAETGQLRRILHSVRAFATKERDSIRGQYGAGSSTYAGYANACDDILGLLDGVNLEPEYEYSAAARFTHAPVFAGIRWTERDEAVEQIQRRREVEKSATNPIDWVLARRTKEIPSGDLEIIELEAEEK